MRPGMIIGTMLFGVVLSIAACGTPRRSAPLRGAVPLATPSEQQGEILYARFCDRCHPGGEGGIGPAINNKALPQFMIKLQVRAGFGAMPGFNDDVISADDLDAIVDYLKALRGNEEG